MLNPQWARFCYDWWHFTKKMLTKKNLKFSFFKFLTGTIMHDLVWNGGHSIWLSFTCSSVRMDWEINGTRRGSKSTPRAYASLRHSGLILILSSFHWFPSPCSFGACDCLNHGQFYVYFSFLRSFKRLWVTFDWSAASLFWWSLLLIGCQVILCQLPIIV